MPESIHARWLPRNLFLMLPVLAGVIVWPSAHNARPEHIISSGGTAIGSVFEELRPSLVVTLGRRVGAATKSCSFELAVSARPSGSSNVRAMSASLKSRPASDIWQEPRPAVPPRCRTGCGSDCGGHYAACYEDFCTAECDYVFCYAGGSQYQYGWQTGIWNGCCYSDAICSNP